MSKRKQTFQRPTKIDEDDKNNNESAIFSSNQNFEDQIKPKTMISNITKVGLTNGYHDNKTESFAAINGGHSSPDSAESTDPKQSISSCLTASHVESRDAERNESHYNHVSIPNTNYNTLFGSSNDSSFSGSTSNSDNEQSYVPQTADTVNELSTAVTDEKDREGHSESDEHDVVNMTDFLTAHELHNGNLMNKTDAKTADLNLLPSQTNFVNDSIDQIKTEMEDVVSQNMNLTTFSSTTTSNSPNNNNNNGGMNGKSTFHCAECGFGFTTKSNCDRHMRTKHGYLRRKDMIQSTQYMASNLTLLPTSSITTPASNKECLVSNHSTTKGTNILLLPPVSTNNLTVASTVPKKLGTQTTKTTVALLANSMLHTTTPFAHKEKVVINGEKPVTLPMPSVVNSNGLSPHPQSNLAPKSTNKRKACNDLIKVPIGCYTSAVLAHITSITTSCSDKSLVVNKTTTMNLNQKTSEGALLVLNGAHSLVNHLTLLNDGGKENYLSNLTEFSCKLCTTGIENGQASIGSCDLDSIIRHIVLEHENVENILSHIALSNKGSPPPIQSSNDPIMEPKNRLTDKILSPLTNMENENVFTKVTPQNNDNDYTMKNGTDLTNNIRPYPLPHKIMRKKLYHNVSQPSNTDRDHHQHNNNNIDSYNAKHDDGFTNGTELLNHKSRPITPKSNANNSNVSKNNTNGLGVDPSLASYFLTFLQQPTLVNGHQEGVAANKNDKSFATQMVPTFTAFQTYMESLQKAWNIVPSSTSNENENNRDSNKHISANEISGNTTPITDISNLTTTATNNSVPEPLLLLENTEDEEMMPLVIKSESQENDEVDNHEEDYNVDVNTPPPSKATLNYKRMSQQQAMAGKNRYNSVMLTNYSPPSPNASSQITGGGGGDGMEEITSYHSEHGNEGGDEEQQQLPHDANNNAMNSFDNSNYHARRPGGYYNNDDGNGIHVNTKLSQVPPPSSTPFFDPRAVPYRTPGPKKFVCVYCQNTYSSRGNVNRHIRNTHFKMKRNGVVGIAATGGNGNNSNDDQVTNLLQYSIFKNNFDGGMNEDEGEGEENVNDSILQEAGNDESCDVTAYITPQTNTLLNGQYCAANIKNGGVDLVAQNGHNGITGNGVYVTSNKRASSSLNPTLQNYTRYMNAANHQQRNSSSALSNSDARNESFANSHNNNNSGNTSSPAYHKLTPGGLYKNMPGPVPIPAYMLSSLKNAITLPPHIIMEDGGANGCCKREVSSLPSSHDMDTTPLLDPNLVSAFYKNNNNNTGHRVTTKSSLAAANHENMNGNGHHNSSAKNHSKTKKVGVAPGNNREKYPKAVTETSLPLLQPKLQHNNATQQPNYASVMEDYYKKYMEMVMGCSSEDNKNQKQINGQDNNHNKNGINNNTKNNNIISNLPYAMLQDFYAQFFNKSTTASNHINNMDQQKDNNSLESTEMENNKENISSKISPQETHISNSPKHHHNISSQHIVEV